MNVSAHGLRADPPSEWARLRPTFFAAIASALPIVAAYGLAAWLVLELLVLLRGPSPLLISTGMGLGAIGIWRYSFLIVNIGRALIYRYSYFPRLRIRADAIPDREKFPDRIYFIIPTLLEQAWVSRRMVHSILQQAAQLPCKAYLYVATGSEEEDFLFAKIVKQHPLAHKAEIFLLRQDDKRGGMGYAIRAAARSHRGEQALVVLMDGDTVLGPGVLEKTLPFFKLLPRLDALTTDNFSLTRGPTWYRDWYNLRFSMRNRYMCSASLSHKLLTLTGRFSVFRSQVAFSEEFLQSIEEDVLDHWLHGNIKLSTGDDKSTCYHVMKSGGDMLYVPDARVYCMENAGASALASSILKMRRWFGNMMRNNWRSIALGPSRVGLFTWCLLIDQRVSMWTTLIGPSAVLMLSLTRSPIYLLYYLIWVLMTRMTYLMVLAMEGHRLSWRDLPLLVFTQWTGSILKIHTLANLSQQEWGEARSIQYNPNTNGREHHGRALATLQQAVWALAFLVVITYLVSNILLGSNEPLSVAQSRFFNEDALRCPNKLT